MGSWAEHITEKGDYIKTDIIKRIGNRFCTMCFPKGSSTVWDQTQYYELVEQVMIIYYI